LILQAVPIGLCIYAEEEPVYVRDLGNVWHIHNYFDDFYISKGGLQINNNLSESWAHIVAGVSFTFRGKNYIFWTDALPLTWTAFNGSNYAELNGTVSLISGKYGTLTFIMHYHLDWNSSYIKIMPILSANLKYAVSNVVLHYRMENINISGTVGNDFCSFLFNNETYTYYLPASFQYSVANTTLSMNHLFIYDNVTWKFVDYVWEWNYTINDQQYLANVTLIGDNYNIQADFTYGNFPLQFTFTHTFWWHDPTEIRYMRSDQHTVNGLTAYKLGLTQTTAEQFVDVDYEGSATAYFDIQIAVRHADGTETTLLPWTRFAIRGTSGYGYQTYNFACPQTSLSPTDAIVVRLRARNHGGSAVATFITEQLGAGQLPSATWTFYVYTEAVVSKIASSAIILWGDSYHNTRVENFQWTPPVTKTWHDIASWSLTLLTRKWNPISSYSLTLNTSTWNNIALWSCLLITGGWHTITSWIINVQSRVWLNIASYNLNMQTRTWQTITSWTQNIITRIWQAIATWTAELATGIPKLWHDITSWTATILTRTWHTIASWIFNAVTLGWHTVAFWTATVEFYRFPFIILIGAITITVSAIIILWKKR